jgi:hypothetical protein
MTVHSAFLAIHIAAGSFGLVLGPVAMLAPKRRGRHTRAGTVYHWNMLVVGLSAIGLAVLAWAQIWWFVPIAVFSYGNALFGYLAVRRKRPGWLPRHIGGMGGSYIALVTALLVVNAGVAAWWAWGLPTVVGSVLLRRTTLRLNRISGTRPA